MIDVIEKITLNEVSEISTLKQDIIENNNYDTF